jgi:hypothetical protein
MKSPLSFSLQKQVYFILLLTLSPTCTNNLFGQKSATLSGYIKDGKTGEALIGATVYIPEKKTGVISNAYGFYSLTVTAGKYQVLYSYVGYKTNSVEMHLDSSKIQNADLFEEQTEIKEVVISAKNNDYNVQSNRMGIVSLDMKQIKQIPVVFGEQDILKTIQMTPGVKSAGEGSSGFYVRGGAADQNLILLDEAPVYNSSHLLGFFSVFNSDAIKNAELLKGGIPASYGGRASSVLDIKMNEGNMKKHSVSGGIGLISSRLALEGPIIKDKSSFIISGRRTYADVLVRSFGDEEMSNMGLYFYDLNAKANLIVNQNNRFYLSGYFGRDVFNFNNRFGFNWGNITTTLRWNHLFSDKLFMNSSAIYSNFDYKIGIEMGSNRLDVTSGIRDFNFKQDFQYFHNTNHSLKFGFNALHHTFFPGESSYSDNSIVNQLIIEKRYAFETGVYMQSDITLTQNFKANAGLRFSNFNLLGPGNYYSFNELGEITDTANYSSGKIVTSYYGWEPRATLAYMPTDESSFKISYTRMFQYLHLLSKSTSTSPSDLWIPSSNIVKPQYVDQYAMGYFQSLSQRRVTLSLEAYYKDLYNQVDYKNGADITINEMVESQLVFGKGKAYGLEFSLEKKEGKLNGWISYTLSRTERIFDEIDNGNAFPAKQDRTHDFNIIAIYQLFPKWSVSGTWVFYTGNAVTYPAGKYTIDGNTITYYTSRNGERMPDYHRLDIGITFTPKRKANRESCWNLSVYNVYARKNAYSISFRENADNPAVTEAVKLSLFSIVPSISYNFRF